MAIMHIKHNNKHLLIDKKVYKILQDEQLTDFADKFALARANNAEQIGEYTQVGNYLTDGSALIIINNRKKVDVDKLNNFLKEIKIGYPPLLFFDNTSLSGFLKLGKTTLFGTLTHKNARLFIPGGEVHIPRHALNKFKIDSIVPDLFSAVIKYGGIINTKLYKKTTYEKIVNDTKYDSTTIIPYYDAVIIIDGDLAFFFDGDNFELMYPFTQEADSVIAGGLLTLKEVIHYYLFF